LFSREKKKHLLALSNLTLLINNHFIITLFMGGKDLVAFLGGGLFFVEV